MADPLLSLNKVITTLKLNMLGEVCRVMFFDGVRIKVDADRFGFRCLGVVQEMRDNKITIRFLAPAGNLKNMVGMNVEISFNADGDFYYFDTKVLNQKDKDIIIVSWPGQLHQKQRREYLRLPLKVPVKIRSIDNQELGQVYRSQHQELTLTKDISGGGVRIESTETIEQGDGIEVILEENLEKNSVVEMEVTLPEVNRTIIAQGQIAWINKVGEKYEVGITYLNIVKKDQDFIVRYILNEQIRRSKVKDIKNIRKKK
jgi:c-di-GMP-binding flagellar brake protein YcgR